MQTKSVFRNFSVNVSGAVISALITLITVPIYIKTVGTDRYGVIAIAWVLLGYFGFLDLGLSRAAANALARLHDRPVDRAEVLATSFALNGTFGFAGGLVIAIFGTELLDAAVTLPPDLRLEAIRAMPWMAALLPLGLLNGIADGALESRERFVLANFLQICTGAAGQIVPVLVAIFVSPGLDYVIPAAVLARGLSVVIFIGTAIAGETRMGFAQIRRSRVKELLTYGGWISVSGLITPLLSTLDQVLIGRIFGPAAVTHYSVPMNLVNRVQILSSALGRTLFPRLSRQSPDEARATAERAVVTLAFAFGSCCVAGVLLVETFLTYWISPAFAADAAPVARLLLVGGWLNGLAFIPYSQLQGQGRPDLTAKFHLAQFLPYALLLWWLTHPFGLVGAATAWVIRVTADFVMLVAAARLRVSALARILVPGLCLLVALGVAAMGPATLAGALSSAVALGLVVIVSGLVLDPLIQRIGRSMMARLGVSRV